jgi:hypothetical protein
MLRRVSHFSSFLVPPIRIGPDRHPGAHLRRELRKRVLDHRDVVRAVFDPALAGRSGVTRAALAVVD